MIAATPLRISNTFQEVDLRWKLAAAAILALPLVVILAVSDPAKNNVFPTCPFLSLTGCYCPGCGTLRGIHQLLQGNLSGAIGFNSLMVASLPIIGHQALMNKFGSVSAWARARAPSPVPASVSANWIWVLLAVVIVFWVVRNIPLQPLSVLAP